jgi:hypothetical protein
MSKRWIWATGLAAVVVLACGAFGVGGLLVGSLLFVVMIALIVAGWGLLALAGWKIALDRGLSTWVGAVVMP